MKIEFTTSPIISDIEFLTNKINEETPEFGSASTYSAMVFMKKEPNK